MDKVLETLNLSPKDPIENLPEDVQQYLAKYKSPKLNKNLKRKKVPFVGKNHPKYKVTLKFANKILANLKKPEVDDLLDFKDIDRLDIIKDENTQALKNMENEIFAKGAFKKAELLYYRKTDNKTIGTLRLMIKRIGLLIHITKKEQFDDKGYRRTHIYYTFKEN